MEFFAFMSLNEKMNVMKYFISLWCALISSGMKAQATDTIAPKTIITSPLWATGNFNANFADTDIGTGVQRRFYGAEENTPSGWRANKLNGFFYDAFEGTTIHPDWTIQSGVWAIENNTLKQSDENNVNSNMYSSVNQNADAILFHWSQKIGGSGTNQRGGLHFMCSAATGNGRGNSYLVLERTDHGGSIQILRSFSDMLFLFADIPYGFISDRWYDFKIVYTRSIGKIDVYVNNKWSGSWTDTSPLTSGNYIGFRNGESIFYADNLEVMKSRTNTANIHVGAANTNDIRLQNNNPAAPAGRIKSFAADSFNFSSSAIQNINVDYTSPTMSVVRDGTGNDISTTNLNTQLSANWNPVTDTQSGIKRYLYAIGTSPGAVNILAWQDNEMQTSVTRTGLRLNMGTTYYFTVKAENDAGLQSTPVNSNGQKVIAALPNRIADTNKIDIQRFSVFQDLSSDLNISFELNSECDVQITLNSITGKEISCLMNSIQQSGMHQNKFDIQNIQRGLYVVVLRTENEIQAIKIKIE